ncbi:UDP-N-acetylglucosamine 2-epimerase [Desulfobacula phenolica]|uniref:GDP/UDP-N,N'-diacetylbacillosamine 2-epimerase (Hydrolysing) n=1 Tax=Desulfobacula phenolica TaxID=90732 RepID=A0A1H2DRY0_9BACT|nr:UDP-N-acetylglucosamine 2-epimerase [Desulfobacula phenolica]SDT85650.1 GDP/UDP-N,N'-diacetylbacillosamine 2-epimerase (hydrolysing) [Desulfobacula phenolica]
MRKICVYTSTRAEYGLLRNFIKEIHEDSNLQLQLLVSGTHLVPEQGMTIEEIRKDGFEPDKCVDIDLIDDSPTGICQSMGTAVSEYGKFFAAYNPDILVVLGDRFEAFCCATAAQVCCVPIAHIHGGETTQGAIDEAFRHSITKMAHLHFPCCEAYLRRIVQMGEQPEYVYNVGALGVENIRNLNLMERGDLEESIRFKLDKPFFLITFHPVTLEKNSSKEQFTEILGALDQYSDHKFVFTGSNADTGGQVVNQMQKDYQNKHPDQCLVVPSLGYLRYLSAMKFCEAVIGNSSSGIFEAPALKVPAINIGDRQKGRIRTESIVDCNPSKESILAALKIIQSHFFQLNLKSMNIPFEKSGTAKKIKEILQTADLKDILKKKFHDIEC